MLVVNSAGSRLTRSLPCGNPESRWAASLTLAAFAALSPPPPPPHAAITDATARMVRIMVISFQLLIGSPSLGDAGVAGLGLCDDSFARGDERSVNATAGLGRRRVRTGQPGRRLPDGHQVEEAREERTSAATVAHRATVRDPYRTGAEPQAG